MYKKIVVTFLVVVFVCIGCFFGMYVAVDPIGTFETPI